MRARTLIFAILFTALTALLFVFAYANAAKNPGVVFIKLSISDLRSGDPVLNYTIRTLSQKAAVSSAGDPERLYFHKDDKGVIYEVWRNLQEMTFVVESEGYVSSRHELVFDSNSSIADSSMHLVPIGSNEDNAAP